MNAQSPNQTSEALLESRGLKHLDVNIERLERELALMKSLRDEYRAGDHIGKARVLSDLLEFQQNFVSTDHAAIREIAISLKRGTVSPWTFLATLPDRGNADVHP